MILHQLAGLLLCCLEVSLDLTVMSINYFANKGGCYLDNGSRLGFSKMLIYGSQSVSYFFRAVVSI